MTLTHCLQCLTRDLGDYLVSLYTFFNHFVSKTDLIKVIVYSKRLLINTLIMLGHMQLHCAFRNLIASLVCKDRLRRKQICDSLFKERR